MTTETEADQAARRHEVTIIINGREVAVTEHTLTFDQVVHLAFPNPPSGPNVTFTITYDHAPGPRHEGTLVEGGEVHIKERTIFNVTPTDKS